MWNVEPSRPRRGCRYSAGPLLSSLIATATAASSGARTSSAVPETTTSTVRLSARALRPRRIGGSVTTGIPSTSSSVACEVKISK